MTNPFAMPEQQAPAPPAQQAPPAPPAPAPAQQNPFTQPAQPTQQQAPAPAYGPDEDPFDAPAPQRPRAPRMRDLYGRLLLIIPHKLEENVRSMFKDKDGNPQFQDRMTMDVTVLDGGTIHYGGKPEDMPPVPHDKTAEVPFRMDKVFDSHAGLISQCREALAKKVTQGRPGMVLGRLTKGEAKGGNNAPYILAKPTDEDRALARQYLATVDPFA